MDNKITLNIVLHRRHYDRLIKFAGGEDKLVEYIDNLLRLPDYIQTKFKQGYSFLIYKESTSWWGSDEYRKLSGGVFSKSNEE